MTESHEKRTETHACDLIDRQAAIDALDDIEAEVADGYGYQYAKWREYFAKMPTVDAVPVRHGRWVWSKRDGAYLCNVCNGGYKGQPTLMGKPMYEWCPVCGARMDGKDGDADGRP